MKIIKTSIALGLILVVGACAQKKGPPTLDDLTVAKIQRDQAQLQALQATANPIIKDINDLQEKAKKDYPGFQIDLNTQKLVPIPSTAK